MTPARTVVGLALLAVLGWGVWALTGRPDPHATFRDAVAAAPGCTTDAQCTILRTTCPLGCAHAIPRDAEGRLGRLASDLVAAHERRFGACAQDCDTAPPVACREARCVFEPPGG